MDKPTQRLNADEQDQDRPAGSPGPASTCTECGGRMIWAEAEASSGSTGHPIRLTTRFFLRKGRLDNMYHTNTTTCKARVCLACGLVKLYATQPQELIKEE